MKTPLLYFLFCVFSVGSLIAVTPKGDSLAIKPRVKKIYLGFAPGCSFMDLQYRYRLHGEAQDKTTSSFSNAEKTSHFTKFVFTYPGLEFGVIAKKGFKMNFALSYFAASFMLPAVKGTTTLRVTQYGPNFTPTGSATYVSDFEVDHKSEIQFLSLSLGLGYSFQLKKGKELGVAVHLGNLKNYKTYIETNGTSPEYYTSKTNDEYNNTRYNHFVGVKLDYMIPHKKVLVFTFGISYYNVFHSDNYLYSSSYYNRSHHLDLRGLNMLNASVGILFKLNRCEKQS